MAECLTGLAHVCEKAASLSWNEEVAIEFEGLARACVDAAIDEERARDHRRWQNEVAIMSAIGT
jgi:hypothetical protein